MGYTNKLTEVICIDCNIKFTITTGTFKKKKNKNRIDWRCKKCTKKIVNKQISDKQKSNWDNKTDEERKEHKIKTSLGMQNMPEETKILRSKNLSKAVRKYFDNRTIEQRISHNLKISQGLNNRSDEAKAVTSQNQSIFMKNYIHNLSEDAQIERNNKLINESFKYRENLTPEQKESRSKNMSNGAIKRYNNLSEEEKILQIQPMRDGYINWRNNLTDEDKKELSQKLIDAWENKTIEEKLLQMQPLWDGRDDYYNNQTLKQKVSRSKNISLGMDNRSIEEKEIWRLKQVVKWNNLSDEEKLLQMQPLWDGRDEWYNNLSDKEKEEYNKNRINSLKYTWDNKTVEERQEHGRKISNTLENRSYEEKAITGQKIKDSYNNKSVEEFQTQCINAGITHNKNLSKNPTTKTEFQFANDLNKLDIDYGCQWSSILLHKDFNKIFPFNNITNSRLINPTHLWDFKVTTKHGDILVDIDGSIHNTNKNKGIVTDEKGNKFKLNEFSKFNDSQRSYQTDGLDSYLVLCYNDKIDNNTPVYNINNDVYLTYEELLNHIKIMNKEDKCINYYY